MRQLRYAVVMSLNGYIAGPHGEADWIPINPEINFNEIFRRYDTALIGRRTYEGMLHSPMGMLPGMDTYVFSQTLQPAAHPNVTIVSSQAAEVVNELKSKPGKDIWLFGGGILFRSLVASDLVDEIEVAVVPMLLGTGLPLMPPPAQSISLTLYDHRVYRAGIVSLTYSVHPRKGSPASPAL